MKVIVARNGRPLCVDCCVADNFFSRFIGLMGKKSLPEGMGLMIMPCNSIHCFFMRFPIDALFLDEDNRVLRMYSELKAWRVTGIVKNARKVIELPAGTLARNDVRVGDVIVFQD